MTIRVALVIEDEYHYRNDLSGVLNFEQDEGFEYHIILPDRFSNRIVDCGQKTVNFVHFSDKRKLFLFAREINRLSNRSRSSSFKFNHLRSYPPLLTLLRIKKRKHTQQKVKFGKLPSDQTVTLHRTIVNLNQIIFFLNRRIRLLLLGLAAIPIWSNLLVELISKAIKEETLDDCILSIRPNVVIYVTSLFESTSVSIARLCRRYGITYVLIADNWDNLCSKRTLWEKPDYVGVWGKQGKRHAREIHGYTNEQILEVGSPRLEPLLKFPISKTSLKSSSQNLLLAGSSLVFDEIHLAEYLLTKLSEESVIINLVYRPYPWRHHEIPTKLLEHPRFSVDEAIKEQILNQVPSFDAKFNDYAHLLHNSHLVVGGLTTMILEAALIGKPVVGIVYDDGSGSLNSPHLGYKNFEHFKGLENFPNIRLCHNKNDLWNLIKWGLDFVFNPNTLEFREIQSEFYNVEKNRNFLQNLHQNLRNLPLNG